MISIINCFMLLIIVEGCNVEIKRGNDRFVFKEGDLYNDVYGNINIKVLNGDYNFKVSGGSGSFIIDKNFIFELIQLIKIKVGVNEIMIFILGIDIKVVKIIIEGQVLVEVKVVIFKFESQVIFEVKGIMLMFQGFVMIQIKGGIVNIG